MFEHMSFAALMASLCPTMLHHQDRTTGATIQTDDLTQTLLSPCMTSERVRHRGRGGGTLLWTVYLEWVRVEIRSHLGKRPSP